VERAPGPSSEVDLDPGDAAVLLGIDIHLVEYRHLDRIERELLDRSIERALECVRTPRTVHHLTETGFAADLVTFTGPTGPAATIVPAFLASTLWDARQISVWGALVARDVGASSIKFDVLTRAGERLTAAVAACHES